MTTSIESLTTELTARLSLAEQIDAVHVSLIGLMDMSREGELDLILDQPNKSEAQKRAYLEKVITEHCCDELREILLPIAHAGEFDFFSKKNFLNTIKHLQRAVESIHIVKLRVAVKFKESDIREMVTHFSKQVGQPVAFDLSVEPSLIGGAVIQYGSYINDYSLAARLKQFREHWRRATIER